MNAYPAKPLAVHLQRIYSEYVEMPGLRLTAAQVERLCGLDHERCLDALQMLVEAGFLRQTPAGHYVRAAEGTAPAGRMPAPVRLQSVLHTSTRR